ncbi:AMP deaminase / myoadenylate deaminase, putative isoform 1 [Theobroma cacao]|uniref:AMP deaminase n=1 Tax=Theobroma cacao TaxID=3641 RepID=A0A061ERB2_THECC|nr:AMP deaminase / myoadenylate deaminase, putative isoform 1 [Theobroma cacao]EOY07159.1 AMP deaminase / myoadenylate deaminase, putative isoform 1 [Theobroma cacao]
MDTYTVHIAMAALVGASLVAVSAYYMHRKTLSQLLEFAKTVEREREEVSDGESPQHSKKRRGHHSRRKGNGYYRRGSASLPDVTVISGGIDGEEKRNGAIHVDGIPPGLPRLHTLPQGKSGAHATSAKRSSSLIRPTSPKSPVASASAFESIEGSDDEDNMTDNSKIDTTYLHTNGKAGPNLPDHINANGETIQIAASSMIRSHSVSGDLHGVQPDPIAADILRKEPEQETFARLRIAPTEVPSADEVEAYVVLQECLEMRKRYVFKEPVAPWEKEVISDPSTPKPNPEPFFYAPEEKSDHYFEMQDGVIHVYANKDSKEELFPVADATTFFTDLHHILRVIAAGNIRTLCHHRLNLLEQKFNLHLMLNADREFLAQKSAPHRDFYNVRKVDTHVHHSACMNQKHLLRFIKSKLRKEPDEVVIFRDGTYLTLKEVFESLDLTGYDLNVDLLDVHADKSTFHRFDKFNLKYNPCGQSRLREIFLKQDNLIQGRFLGELTKQVFSDLAASKYQMAEYRISIYGRKQSEWDQLASWIVNNDLYSENVVWLIQIPRLYNIYKEMGIVTSFQNILDNIFIPLFEVTVDPDSHPHLHVFLKQVVGLDLVDDESKPERRPTKHMPTPDQWTNVFNPAYSYYVYYCYANLYTLNKLRESKGMTTIKFRPHSGEAGDIDHLAATFLTAHNIAHGINLRKSPVLQYLYYLAQIGLAMSPLSNNSLFLDYHRNPFPMFFLRGLNVSLSTDDPLQIHLTKEPLVEEYSIAASVWKLSSCDLCEIARNSVYQSGFSHALKSHWIGKEYYKRGPDGNDIHRTNVPHIRLEFRDTIWKEEMQQVYLGKAIIPQEVDK